MVSLSEPSHWVAIFLSSDATICSVSPNVEELTGYPAAELVGHPITQILADRSVFEMPQMMSSAREWGRWEGEIVHRDRSGKALNARGFLTLLCGRGGPEEGFLLLSTSSRSLPAGVSEDYLHQVGDKLRMIAHQMNNPLAVMMGFAQLMLMEIPGDGRIRADLERIYAEMKRVTQAVETLHTYAVSLQREPDVVPTHEQS
jgi:PAS domain S-box-containing protein